MAEKVTAEYLEQAFESAKSWGRWGKDDPCGALNYITDKKRAAAAALVRDGGVVSCAQEFPTRPAPDNPYPALHMMVAAGDACTISEVLDLGTAIEPDELEAAEKAHGARVEEGDVLRVATRRSIGSRRPASSASAGSSSRRSRSCASRGAPGRPSIRSRCSEASR
jgi:hypothetical protein